MKMVHSLAASICEELGEQYSLIPVIKRAVSILGVEVVDSFISEAKREFGSHFVENKRLRTTGGIFLRKLKQTPHKRFIFKGQKPESI